MTINTVAFNPNRSARTPGNLPVRRKTAPSQNSFFTAADLESLTGSANLEELTAKLEDVLKKAGAGFVQAVLSNKTNAAAQQQQKISDCFTGADSLAIGCDGTESVYFIKFTLIPNKIQRRDAAALAKIALLRADFIERIAVTRKETAERVSSAQQSAAKLEIQRGKIEKYARVAHHVLLTGERGTGKTTIARQIHEKGVRRQKPFVSLNCATLKEELVEAELFGYEKGAFTGAGAAKPGLFEAGSGGTVFLDEIGELSLALQAKLLKAVEERKIRRVGAAEEREIDLRIITATSRDLPAMVERGEFRADLYDRLNVLSINTIPLREQREKIRDLVLEKLEIERIALARKTKFKIDRQGVAALENYHWSGNFRELQNFVTKLAIEHQNAETITLADVAALFAEKSGEGNRQAENESNGCRLEPTDEILSGIEVPGSLEDLLETVKERFVLYHLKNKSARGFAREAKLSRNTIKKTIDKFKLKSNTLQ
jgi:transcriptional regulator with PAS, ATPase and Fis domain